MVFAIRKEEELSEKLVRVHRAGFEKRDREGFLVLFDGNVSDAIAKFTLAEKHSRKLAVLLQSAEERNSAMEGSLEMSNRVSNLRALSSGDGKRAGATMLKLIAELKR